MLAYLLRRISAAVPLVLLVAFATFALVFMMPGDPAAMIAGDGATAEQIAEVRRSLGFDQPFLTQFTNWVGDLVQGDLGDSFLYRVPVTEMLSQRWAITASIVVVGLAFAVLIGVPVGMVAGLRPGSRTDRIVTGITTLGLAIPAYWLAMLLIGGFAIGLGWFDATGYTPISQGIGSWFRSLVLPGLAVASTSAADIARQTRSTVATVGSLDYVRTCEAMGISRTSVVVRHVLRNASVPVVTVIGLQVERLIGSAVVVEMLFAMPGLGTMALNAVTSQDIPSIQGVVIVIAAVVIVTNVLVDVSYGFLDPKLRRR